MKFQKMPSFEFVIMISGHFRVVRIFYGSKIGQPTSAKAKTHLDPFPKSLLSPDSTILRNFKPTNAFEICRHVFIAEFLERNVNWLSKCTFVMSKSQGVKTNVDKHLYMDFSKDM